MCRFIHTSQPLEEGGSKQAKQSKAKQRKAKQSNAKQSKQKALSVKGESGGIECTSLHGKVRTASPQFRISMVD